MKYVCWMLMLLAGSTAALLDAAPPDRLHQEINRNETFVLAGHVRPLLASAQDLGPAASSLALPQLELHFQMTPAQAAELQSLLAAQRDRGSPSYRKWLTPEEYAARFGLSEKDGRQITRWLESSGFTNVEISRSRTSVRMSGTAGDLNTQFGVAIHNYRREGKNFYANANDPVLPRALQGVVSGLKGMSNYRVRPFIRRAARPQITVGINGNHFLGPGDLATIYNLNPIYAQGTDGAGQTIAIVGQSDIDLADIAAFQTASKLPVKLPQVILAGEDPGLNADDESEADLDLEWSGAVARGATILYVNSPDALQSAQYAIENNLAPIVSISYGLCEAALPASELNAVNAAFQQASAQGITVSVASGDTGAAACDIDRTPTGAPEIAARFGPAVSFPASSPYVTAVGGTEFDDAYGSFWDASGRATSYIPEIAWNDTAILNILSGTGGGASLKFTKPDWQQGSGVPNDGARDVPDIAFSASPVHDPYLICTGGSCSSGFTPPVDKIYFVGGTSCAAPVFAGLLALLNQSSGGRVGNVNPALYALASFDSGVFHDITLGNNIVPCVTGSTDCPKGTLGFTTEQGYDQVTGLGSLDATQFLEQWGSDFQLTVTPSFISIASGGTGSTDIQVTRFANFAGNVTFSCSVPGTLSNTTCSITSPVTGSGVAVLSINNTASASALLPRFRLAPPSSAIAYFVGACVLLLWARRSRRFSYPALATLCLLTAVSCGSGNGGLSSNVSQSVTGTVTVVATSGVLHHSITVPVTIT